MERCCKKRSDWQVGHRFLSFTSGTFRKLGFRLPISGLWGGGLFGTSFGQIQVLLPKVVPNPAGLWLQRRFVFGLCWVAATVKCRRRSANGSSPWCTAFGNTAAWSFGAAGPFGLSLSPGFFEVPLSHSHFEGERGLFWPCFGHVGVYPSQGLVLLFWLHGFCRFCLCLLATPRGVAIISQRSFAFESCKTARSLFGSAY